MSCGTCGLQASDTMQGDTGVPAGAPSTGSRRRCPICRAFIADTGGCANPRCPTRGPVAAVMQAMHEALADPSWQVRHQALETLVAHEKAAAIPLLTDIFTATPRDRYLTPSALLALGQVAGAAVLPHCATALADAWPALRLTAVRVLGGLDEAQAIPLLERACQDAEAHVRCEAVASLAATGRVAALPGVTALLHADPSHEVRAAAATALGRYIGGEQSIKPLRNAALADSASEVRLAATRALAEMPAPEPLLEVLHAGDPVEVRQAAVEGLAQIGGDQALAAIVDAYKEDDLRESVVTALGTIGTTATDGYLLLALRDSNSHVRWAAVEALGQRRCPQAVPHLERILQERQGLFDVQDAAARALAHCAGPAALPALREALVRGGRQAEAPVRQAVVEALGLVGGAEAEDLLQQALHEDGDYFVQQEAVASLEHIGTPVAVQSLVAALPSATHGVRLSIIPALGRLSAKYPAVCTPPLLRALREPATDWEPQYQAARALVNVPGPATQEALVEALRHKQADVRLAAAETLGQVGAGQHLAALQGLLTTDPDPLVRSSAVAGLGTLGGSSVLPTIQEAMRDASAHVRLGAVLAQAALCRHP